MKLWYQSVASLGHDPVWSDYESAVARHISLVKEPETQVYVRGLEETSPQDAEKSPEILKNAVKAEKEGYDGFILGCFMDPRHESLRSFVEIPVVFTGETSMHLASLLGKKFVFLATSEGAARRIFKNVGAYGLLDRAPISAFLDLSLEALARAFKDPAYVLDLVFKRCEELVSQGAEVIIPGCGVLNALLAFHKVRRYKGALILDTLGSAIKVGEMMVGLNRKVGLNFSRVKNNPLP